MNEMTVKVSTAAKKWLAFLKGPLQQFYRERGHTLSDRDAMWEIEKVWGPEIVEKVCIPYGLVAGSCLVIALAVAKEGYRGRMAVVSSSTKAFVC